jgi:2-octaprenylphenol hydroxylase
MTQAIMPLAVVGGGIVAGCAARLFAQRGHDVLWVGPKEPLQRSDGADQRAYALGPQAVSLLSDLGLWQTLKGHAQPIVSMEIRQSGERPASGQPADLALNAQELGEDCLAWIVSHTDLLAPIDSPSALPTNISRAEAALHKISAGGLGLDAPAVLRLENDELYKARLVLAADGQRSTVRRRLGLGWGIRRYQQTALVCRLQSQKAHESVAMQWFQSGAVLALLPLKDPNQVSLVYSLPNDRLRHFQSLSDEAFSQELSLVTGHRLGELSQPTARVASPLAMTLVPETSLGRVLLLGDAAHTVHPLAGYGLNLGFQDLLRLDTFLSRHGMKAWKDHGDPGLLAQFAAQRHQSVQAVQWGLDGLWRLIQPSPNVFELGRQFGLRAIQKVQPLRHQLIQLAFHGA